jgi:hypothetical protein
VSCRLDASYEAAVKYVGQFPSPLVTLVSYMCIRHGCMPNRSNESGGGGVRRRSAAARRVLHPRACGTPIPPSSSHPDASAAAGGWSNCTALPCVLWWRRSAADVVSVYVPALAYMRPSICTPDCAVAMCPLSWGCAGWPPDMAVVPVCTTVSTVCRLPVHTCAQAYVQLTALCPCVCYA